MHRIFFMRRIILGLFLVEIVEHEKKETERTPNIFIRSQRLKRSSSSSTFSSSHFSSTKAVAPPPAVHSAVADGVVIVARPQAAFGIYHPGQQHGLTSCDDAVRFELSQISSNTQSFVVFSEVLDRGLSLSPLRGWSFWLHLLIIQSRTWERDWRDGRAETFHILTFYMRPCILSVSLSMLGVRVKPWGWFCIWPGVRDNYRWLRGWHWSVARARASMRMQVWFWLYASWVARCKSPNAYAASEHLVNVGMYNSYRCKIFTACVVVFIKNRWWNQRSLGWVVCTLIAKCSVECRQVLDVRISG